MSESDFKIAIIGLGIIGGSMAYALRGFKNAVIVGCDTDSETRRKAVEKGAVSYAFEDAKDAIDNADLVIICVYPDSIRGIISDNAEYFKKGSVITDVCGVKAEIAKQVKSVLPEGVDYVGGHPMAGKETEGFDSATSELFWMTGFIITPIDTSKDDSIMLIKEMAKYVGATRITTSTPKEHDAVIAYTSDLMHISAAALCLDFNEGMNRAYTAGAFRDCTRIAHINPDLWTELFLRNRENVLHEVDRYMKSLKKIKNAIEVEDEKKLHALLSQVRDNKKFMQNSEPKDI